MRHFALLAALSLPALAEEPPLPARDLPAGRAELALPDDVWERALAGNGSGRRPLGFTSDEMKNYGGRDHLLRSVENLFRDVRTISRTTGRIADELQAAAKAGGLADISMMAWGLTDVPAGRMYAAPAGEEWGVGIAKGVSAGEALKALLGADAMPADFEKLPASLQRFLVRLAIARRVALPWLAQTIPASDAEGMHASVTAPWVDEENGQGATLDGRCFRWLRDVDRAPVAYGAALFLAHVKVALAELKVDELADVGAIDWSGIPGIRVLGTGDDTITGPQPSIVVDLGGKDRWSGRIACSSGPSDPLSVVFDLGGDDVYDGGEEPFTMGCGVFGLGALFDLGGNDRYTVKESGLGCAWFGTALLWDASGNDVYVVKDKWGQGAAHMGAGILVDLAGDDAYECAQQSQGLGSTLGTGLLLDLAGNDAYVCRDDGNVSALYLNQSVAMAQGCGYGRRADIGDGRSLAGGWGLLIDGAGDDRYHAQCWSQGCGYWWAVGALEDHAGNDVYENGKYSLGAGAHYAIGVQVDLAGDDRYNAGVATTKNQFQGHARDASVGISIDGDGNDRYLLKNMCGGSADLCSVALFWDRRGNDVYEATMDQDMGEPGPWGSATKYPPMRTFRDDLPAIGVFLDTGGRDTYAGDPRSDAGAKDAARWTERRSAQSFGFGWDAEAFR